MRTHCSALALAAALVLPLALALGAAAQEFQLQRCRRCRRSPPGRWRRVPSYLPIIQGRAGRSRDRADPLADWARARPRKGSC